MANITGHCVATGHGQIVPTFLHPAQEPTSSATRSTGSTTVYSFQYSGPWASRLLILQGLAARSPRVPSEQPLDFEGGATRRPKSMVAVSVIFLFGNNACYTRTCSSGRLWHAKCESAVQVFEALPLRANIVKTIFNDMNA